MSQETDSTEKPTPTLSQRWQRIQPWIAGGLIVIALGNVIRLPYYSLGPGPATDVITLIEVKGLDTFEPEGELLLTTAAVSNSQLTAFEYLWTFVDPSLAPVPKARFAPDGTTDAERDAANLAAMDQSKYSAELAAFGALGLEVRRNPGARVLTVVPGTPAAASLQQGDRLLQIEGTAIGDAADVTTVLDQFSPGANVVIEYARGGKLRSDTFTLGSLPEDPQQPRLGVQVVDSYRMPAEISIDTQRIGGPSGGLVFALALYELLSEEDLTRGRIVAATGEIGFENGIAVVGDIGGIGEKISGAKDIGAEIFLVPQLNFEEALAAAPDGLQVIPVATFQDALTALRMGS